jgi:LacI family transcriptional regulator
MPSRPITIRDVARLSQVSIGTVSRVLNQRPGVHPETRRRVLEVVERLGYTPLPAARELSGHTGTVGILLSPDVRRYTPYYILLFERLSEALWRQGLQLEETPVDPTGLPLAPAAGYILLGAHDHDPRLEVLRAQGVPFVLIGVYAGVFWVAPDDPMGSYLATRHLLELGHRRILHLTGHLHHQAGRERLAGYRQALLEAGIEPQPEWILDGDFSDLQAYRALRKAWEQGVRGTALVAASDEMALGALAALEDLGVKVPAEVSVVGFDDLPELPIPLTTARQEIAEIAEIAAQLLQEALAGNPPRGVRVPVRLVVRSTTARRGGDP